MSTTEINRNRASKKKTDEAQQVKALQESMSSIKHKFLALSSQGGVGKTSVIVSLAVALAKKGMKVGMMDANFHGPDIRKMLGLEPKVASNSDNQFLPWPYLENLKVASIESLTQDIDETGVWGKPLEISDIRRFIFSTNWGELDYLFVDTPAGPGEKLQSMVQAFPGAKFIIVTTPNKISGDRAKKMIKFFKRIRQFKTLRPPFPNVFAKEHNSFIHIGPESSQQRKIGQYIIYFLRDHYFMITIEIYRSKLSF